MYGKDFFRLSFFHFLLVFVFPYYRDIMKDVQQWQHLRKFRTMEMEVNKIGNRFFRLPIICYPNLYQIIELHDESRKFDKMEARLGYTNGVFCLWY